MKTLKKIVTSSVIFWGTLTSAHAGHSIGTSSGSLYTKVTTALQDAVNFLDGPAATAFVAIALVVALAAWNFAPQNAQWVGKSVRAVISGILVFAITVIINYLRSI